MPAAALPSINSADPAAVVTAFREVRKYLQHDRWLSATNRYRTNTVSALGDDLTAGTLNQKNLVEYIAASAPLHLSDGWAFLGRSMQAHLVGDRSTARHLAYYAELRAAMSLLATNGLGVFDRAHFAVTGPKTAVQIHGSAGSTHLFAWRALQWWSMQSTAWDLVSAGIRPHGIELGQWIAAAPKYASWGPVVTSWIQSLGLDIQRVADDQYSRNEASYRPTRMLAPAELDTCKSATFAVNVWRALEPGARGFPNLESHILRMTLEQAFEAVEGVPVRRKPGAFASVVRGVSGSVLTEPSERERIARFLLRETEPDDIDLLRLSSRKTASTNVDHHTEIMARAAVLLTVASTAVRNLADSAGFALNEANDWWHEMGAERGIWSEPPEATELLDLWDDVVVELDDLEDWVERNSTGERFDLLADRSPSITRLGQFEIAALWGLPA